MRSAAFRLASPTAFDASAKRKVFQFRCRGCQIGRVGTFLAPYSTLLKRGANFAHGAQIEKSVFTCRSLLLDVYLCILSNDRTF